MVRPILTSITVTYNDLEGLKRTVRSFQEQEATEVAHLIVDGNSTDGSKEFLNQICYPGLTVISEPDKGLYDAMNKGIQNAEGEYVQFLNAGDVFVDNQVLNRVVHALKESTADFVFGETIDVDEEGNVLGERRLQVGSRKVDWKLFRTGMRICHQAMFVKRRVAPLYNLNYQLSADFDWSIQCLKKSQSASQLGFPVIYFEKGGLTTTRRWESLSERFKIMSKHYGFLPTLLRHLYFPIRAVLFQLKNGWH